MMVKAILLICAQALMIQSIAGNCIGSRYAAASLADLATPCSNLFDVGPYGLATGPLSGPYGVGPCGFATGLGAGLYGAAAAAASNGGALPTSSASAIPASGVSLISENVYEGALYASGALPFLGTVALEGALPTAGAGAVAFGAGNGDVAMLREDFGAAYGAGPYAIDALGYRAGPYAGDALGYGPGPYAFDALGYRTGPYARAGCGCGALI